jgi:putative mRNA 3-end processing factor
MPAKKNAQREAAFVWSDGVRIAGTQIWCDARRRPGSGAVCFVSHAHHPVAWPGSGRVRVLAHPRTLALAPKQATDALPSAFGRPFAIGRLRLELLPSGHIPGAAQLLVESPEGRVLYAGDVNPRPGRLMRAAGETLQVRAADALLIEAYLAPISAKHGPLPPREPVEEQLTDDVRRTLASGATPVIKVDPPGGAGEVAALLLAGGLPVRAHRRVAAQLALYPKLGLELGGKVAQQRGAEGGAAILWPWEAKLPEVPRRRLILVDGAAIDPQVARTADAAYPLSDMADLPSLLEFAAATGARDVFFSSGYDEAVARAFADRRMRAHALVPPSQMVLL